MSDIIWKGTTQGSFQQSLVEIGSVVELGGHLDWKSGSPDTTLEGGHPKTIQSLVAIGPVSEEKILEFPIGSYVKLSSAVGAILVEGPNRLTYFWKRTIQ